MNTVMFLFTVSSFKQGSASLAKRVGNTKCWEAEIQWGSKRQICIHLQTHAAELYPETVGQQYNLCNLVIAAAEQNRFCQGKEEKKMERKNNPMLPRASPDNLYHTDKCIR